MAMSQLVPNHGDSSIITFLPHHITCSFKVSSAVPKPGETSGKGHGGAGSSAGPWELQVYSQDMLWPHS